MVEIVESLNLYINADFETSKRPNSDGVYAWLTGYKVCGIMKIVKEVNKEKRKSKIIKTEWLDTEILDKLNIDNNIKYFYGKHALKDWLSSIFEVSDICYKNNIKVHVFFHNARYDFSYIQYYVLSECGKYNNKSKEYYLSNVVIDENNTFYGCQINLKKRIQINKKRKQITTNIIVHDLYKILPSKLDSIGKSVGIAKGKDFDYDMIRKYDYVPTEHELVNYFFNDILIMEKAYKRLPNFFYGHYTIGSIVKNYYLNEHLPKCFPNKNEDYLSKDIFPNSGEVNEYTFRNNELIPFDRIPYDVVMKKVLQAYKGGMTICNNEYLDKTIYNDKLPLDLIPVGNNKVKINEDINHLDVNSLYPSVMYNNEFPIGLPKIVYSDYERDNTKEFEKYLINEMNNNNKRIIIQLGIKRGNVKKGKAPLFLKNDLNKELYNVQKDNTISESNGYKAFYETFNYNVENLTLEEFLILKKNYNIKYEIRYAIVFNSCKNLFKTFIEELVALKIKYDNDEFLRLCYKLCLNNLYGKFGEKIEKTTLYKDLDNNGDWITGEKKIKNGKYFYPPVAVYTTSYARITMMKYINIVGWKNVLYMDTDSIHLIGEKLYNKLVKNNCVHDTELGKLKLEDICFAEKCLSPKKYAYYGLVLKKNKEMFKVKCAGLPDKAQQEIKNFNQFEYGLTFIPKDLYTMMLYLLGKEKGTTSDFYSNIIPVGKLAQCNVKGGIYLKPCIFQIRIPDYIKLQYGIDDINNNDIFILIL